MFKLVLKRRQTLKVIDRTLSLTARPTTANNINVISQQLLLLDAQISRSRHGSGRRLIPCIAAYRKIKLQVYESDIPNVVYHIVNVTYEGYLSTNQVLPNFAIQMRDITTE
jgi:hypothetical protein